MYFFYIITVVLYLSIKEHHIVYCNMSVIVLWIVHSGHTHANTSFTTELRFFFMTGNIMEIYDANQCAYFSV